MAARTLDDIVADWKNPRRMLSRYYGPTAVQLIREAAEILEVVEHGEDLSLLSSDFREIRSMLQEQTGIM